MKKISCLLAALTALTLLVFVAPTTRAAVDNSNIEKKFAPGTTQAECPVCKKTVTWNAIPSSGKLVISASSADHYYAAADSDTFSMYVAVNKQACLHLNGKTLRSAGRPFDVVGTANMIGNGTVIGAQTGGGGTMSVGSTGEVNLYGGTYKLASGACSNVISVGGTVNLYGGTVDASGCKEDWYPGGVYLYGQAEFNLYGGTVKNGVSTGRGGNIAGDSGTINLYGGTVSGGKAQIGGNVGVGGELEVLLDGATISGGTATNIGGNIVVRSGSFEMRSGTVTGGSAVSGGNIAFEGISGIHLNGGTVKGGKASACGGNLYMTGSTVNLDGVSVSGGTVTDGNTGGGNIYLSGDSTVIQASGTISGGKASNHGGNIYVYKGVYKFQKGKISGGSAKKGSSVFLFGGDGIASTFLMTTGTISGGTIDAPGRASVLTIEGGTINAPISGNGTFKFTGGTYANDVSRYVVGKAMYKTPDGKYVTFDDNGMAAIVGTQLFESVETALKKASASKPLALLANYEGTLTVTKDLSIDLNGYSLGGIELQGGKLKVINEKAYPGTVAKLTGDLSKVTLTGASYKRTFTELTNTGTWTVSDGVYGPITNKEKASMTIFGGVFDTISGGKLLVSGGVLGSDISDSLAEGVKSCKTADGIWIIYNEKDGALVDGTKYASLAEALASKPYGKTVILLKDCAETICLTEPDKDAITIDLNGCTLAGLTVGEGCSVTVNVSNGGKVTKLDATTRPGVVGGDYVDAFDLVISRSKWTVAGGKYGDIENHATMTITGGTFLGTISGDNIAINGGSFAQDVRDWVAEEIPVAKKDGMYLVGVEPEAELPWLYIAIGSGAVVLLAAVITLVAVISKKKRSATADSQ